jgi:type IV conjugative transfer system protein TraL
MSYDPRHKLFNHLDQPPRFLLWTFSEAFVLLAPWLLGVALNQGVLGILMSVVSFWGMRAWERHFGQNSLKGILYWYFPHNGKKLKITPPSSVREYLA